MTTPNANDEKAARPARSSEQDAQQARKRPELEREAPPLNPEEIDLLEVSPFPEDAPEAHLAGEDPDAAFRDTGEPLRVPTTPSPPVLRELPPPASPREADLRFREVLRFHVRSKLGELEPVGDDHLPALLHAFRDASKVRTAYPLFLFPPEGDPEGRLALPIADLLEEGLDRIAPQHEQARILADNLKRVERHVRDALAGVSRPLPARPLFEAARDAVIEELGLRGANREQFARDLDRLVAELPEDGQLLPFGEHATFHLLVLAARHRIRPRRAAFRAELRELASRLSGLLEVERAKSAEARRPEALEEATGPAAGRFIDPSALAEVLGPPRGSEPMPAKRRARIEETLATIRAYLEREDPLLTLVHDGGVPKDWTAGLPDVRVLRRSAPCLAAADLFDELAADMAKVIRAARIARLETSDTFQPGIDKPLLEDFTWEAFDDDELRLIPAIVAFENPDSLVGQGMVSLSHLLISGRPVQVLVRLVSTGSPGVRVDQDPLKGFRLELGFLGISHRVALVEQSSAARPSHLLESLTRGFDATRTALHLVASGLNRRGLHPRLGSWLHSGAALESRAHPFFRYDPEGGESWAECFDFHGNPQPQMDWPVYELEYRKPDGSPASMRLAFTFADFALLEPAFNHHFCHLPPGCPEDRMVSVEDWVKLPWSEAGRKVPYIWAVDGENRLERLAISRSLALATRDRLSYWHTLQELGGVNSLYARLAAEAVRKAERARFEQEKAELLAQHQAEIEAVRREEAARALERLAQALLAQDPGKLVAGLPAAPAAVSATTAPASSRALEAEAPATAEPASAEAEAPDKEEEAEEELAFTEPYIDSVLCTSCNECISINPRLFVYNENKQAMIGDPKAGTYEELVRAAEGCPARCIHPGLPLNPDEPGLDALIERAKPFNQA